MSDPRLIMAETYRMLRGDSELTQLYTEEVNNCESPDDAIEISFHYQELAGLVSHE